MGHIHANDEFDFTVSGYLIHDGKTLLIKHKSLPLWTPPAGHVELNQTPIDALYNEIKEEAGIDASHLQLIETQITTKQLDRGVQSTYLPVPFDMEWHTIGNDGHRHIDQAYILSCDTLDVAPDEGESQEYRWFNESELSAFEGANASIINRGLYAINFMKENN